MGAIDDLRIARAAGVTVTVEDESLLPVASVEPPFEQPCVARRGRIEQRPDGFLHFCIECGRWAAFGYGVSLREGRLGQWYCAAHRPEAQCRGEQVPAVDACQDGTQTEGATPNAANHASVGGRFKPLPPAQQNWIAEDWRRRFDERTAIAEQQHGMSRAAAERFAFKRCVVEWLDVNPNASFPGQCTWCGKLETVNAALLPFGSEPGGHTWLHGACWPAWHRAREAEAITALRAVGIQT